MARLRHLVVVLPGIGGSELVDADGPAFQVTVDGLRRLVFRPDRLDIARPLNPTGLVAGLTVVPWLLTLPGYARVRRRLAEAFDNVVEAVYRPGQVPADVDVLVVPYDFRQSVATSALWLAQAVEEALSHRPVREERRVIVLAHSLGGLVARYWVGVLGGWRECRALLTLGTPVRGAPKALDWLVNGARLGRRRHPGMTRVLRGWPSMYELLPQYEAVWDADAGAAVELTELPPSLVGADPDGLAEYAPVFASMAAEGRRVHEAIRAGWAALAPDQVPAVVPYMGRGHATPNLVTLDGGRLVVSKQDPPWRDNVGWGGDGTVPMLGAVPVELRDDPDQWRVVAAQHGPMASIGEPIEVLRSFAGQRVPARGVLPERPWLGLDWEELAVAGDPVSLGVTVWPVPAPEATARALLSPVDPPGPAVRVELRPDANGSGGPGWRGVVAGLPAGAYELVVEVQGGPEAGTVAATQTLLVVDPDEGPE